MMGHFVKQDEGWSNYVIYIINKPKLMVEIDKHHIVDDKALCQT